jgi:hypothetical protein
MVPEMRKLTQMLLECSALSIEGRGSSNFKNFGDAW